MKELRFRAWDYDDNKMVYFDGIFNRTPFTETSTFVQYESCKVNHKLSDIERCTDLPDINGKMIYEGDFVRESGKDKIIWDGDARIIEPARGIIVWDGYGWNVRFINGGKVELLRKTKLGSKGDIIGISLSKYDGSFYGWGYIDIIGNTHESTHMDLPASDE